MKLRKIKKYIRRQQRIGRAKGEPARVNCGLYWFIRFALRPAGGYPTGPLVDDKRCQTPLSDEFEISFLRD